MRVKASKPALPPGWERFTGEVGWDAIAQWALGAYEHYLLTGDEAWLTAARDGGELLLSDPDVTIQGDRVTHLNWVVKRV